MNALQRDVRNLRNELQRRDTVDAGRIKDLSIAKANAAIYPTKLENVERQLLEDREKTEQITKDLNDANIEVAILHTKLEAVERQCLENSEKVRQLTHELNERKISEEQISNLKRQRERKEYK